MSRFWNPMVKSLHPYVPGEQSNAVDLIKLNTNESPYGPPASVVNAIRAAADDGLRLYPDPTSRELREAFALEYQLTADQVFVGNGSDEVLAHAFLGLLKQQRPLLFPDISYSFYPVYCGLYGIEFKTMPLAEDFSLDLGAYSTDNGGIIFPNPNAPTGMALPLSQIRALLERNRDSVVVVDEAYVDFGAESAATLIDEYEQLLVVQTLSKSRALAGLRVGFALGQKHLIEGLVRVKDSFNSYPLDRLAQAGAIASLRDREAFESVRDLMIDTRESLRGELQSMNFEVLPSAANFLFVRHREKSASSLFQALRDCDIMVRHFERPRIDNWLRITVGTPEQCAALTAALKAIL